MGRAMSAKPLTAKLHRRVVVPRARGWLAAAVGAALSALLAPVPIFVAHAAELEVQPASLSASRPTPRPAPRLGPDTGLPVPRFASLKFDEVNGREGPSFDHPIVWLYVRRGLPVEVIEEALDWRKIRDPDGDEVWMHQRVLESRRTGLVAGVEAQLLRRPETGAAVAAIADPGVMFEIKDCRGSSKAIERRRV